MKEKTKVKIKRIFMNFTTEKYRLKHTIKDADFLIRTIIDEENEFVDEESTKLANIYWEAYKEGLDICYIIKDFKKLNDGLQLVAVMIEEATVNKYIYQVTDWVHNTHPEYMKMRTDLSLIMNNIRMKRM